MYSTIQNRTRPTSLSSSDTTIPQASKPRGKLKLFFGAEAGVGKTHAMLELAREMKCRGTDVIVGWIPNHGRPEIKWQLEQLEVLPQKTVAQFDKILYEFDLDAALVRHPKFILIDELAHRNPPGSRHIARWQDVKELLNAGINVFSTLNIQQLESLNEEISRITGIKATNTVPDPVFDEADEVRLIDLPPDELIFRMQQAKIHLPELTGQAIRHYYHKGILLYVRELALRRMLEKVESQTHAHLRHDFQDSDRYNPPGNRILVCIGPNSEANALVKSARRIASSLHAPWYAIYVNPPEGNGITQPARQRIYRALNLAEQLGGEAMILPGTKISEEIIKAAKQFHVTKIIFGRPRQKPWARVLLGSVIDQVINHSAGIDCCILNSTGESLDLPHQSRNTLSNLHVKFDPGSSRSIWSAVSAWGRKSGLAYIWASILPTLTTVLAIDFIHIFDSFTFVLLYVMEVYWLALRFGRNPSILAACLSTAYFAFFFTPPANSFLITDSEDLITLVAMSTLAIVTSNLVDDFRMQAKLASQRERHVRALYSLNREIAEAQHEEELLKIAVRRLFTEFESTSTIMLSDETGTRLVCPRGNPLPESLVGEDLGFAERAYKHFKGLADESDIIGSDTSIVLPIHGSAGLMGVVMMQRQDALERYLLEDRLFFNSFLHQIVVGIERLSAIQKATKAAVNVEKEILRNSLLSSISHDLRTPLTAIFGSSCLLTDKLEELLPEDRHELANNIRNEAQKMTELTEKILNMTKLSDEVQLKKDWYPLEEIVERSVVYLESKLGDRQLKINLASSAPLVFVDATLIQQVLVNLLENAAKYTPSSAGIEISSEVLPHALRIKVDDNGPGIPKGMGQHIFEKFFSFNEGNIPIGAGLGLSICKAVVDAHGGFIGVDTKRPSGAHFFFDIPIPPNSPQFELEQARVT